MMNVMEINDTASVDILIYLEAMQHTTPLVRVWPFPSLAPSKAG